MAVKLTLPDAEASPPWEDRRPNVRERAYKLYRSGPPLDELLEFGISRDLFYRSVAEILKSGNKREMEKLIRRMQDSNLVWTKTAIGDLARVAVRYDQTELYTLFFCRQSNKEQWRDALWLAYIAENRNEEFRKIIHQASQAELYNFCLFAGSHANLWRHVQGNLEGLRILLETVRAKKDKNTAKTIRSVFNTATGHTLYDYIFKIQSHESTNHNESYRKWQAWLGRLPHAKFLTETPGLPKVIDYGAYEEILVMEGNHTAAHIATLLFGDVDNFSRFILRWNRPRAQEGWWGDIGPLPLLKNSISLNKDPFYWRRWGVVLLEHGPSAFQAVLNDQEPEKALISFEKMGKQKLEKCFAGSVHSAPHAYPA